MGKRAKTSRKGKKEWRANISTEETENFFIKQGQEERAGGPLDAVPSDSLFFVDKSKDVTIEKKTTKNRNKVLHYESILQRNSMIPPLRATMKRKTKRKDRDEAKPAGKGKALPVVQMDVAEVEDKIIDIWEESQGKPKKLAVAKKDHVPTPALEVDAPGCSYNPTFGDHQEALGLAVAQEMGKMYKKELEPEPVPRIVSGFPVDDEDVFFLDADEDGEENENEVSAEEGDAPSLGSRVVKVKKLTRAELNRKARRRENLRVESDKKKKMKVKKDVQRLPEILDDIVTEQEEKEKFRIRRKTTRDEKRARGPPRLGKHKFKPEPMQVLLTDEVTGSLRKIKGCYTLLRDRFKSLQRRGILEPRVPISRKQWKKRIMYEQGSKGQKEREMHAAMLAEREARKQALAVIPVP
ncbi:unnamed protein product [Calypogeia fissa]